MKQTLSRLPGRSWGWLAGILTIYTALVIGNMTRWSIWFDEAFSAYIVRFDYLDIMRYTAADVHPPLYYWLLKAWTTLLGTDELAFRSMSLLAGIIAIIGTFVLIRRLFKSDNLALVASAAMAFSPMVIRFSHEARMYLMVLAIVVWATYFLVRATEKNARVRWWIGYTVLIAAGMLTHYFVALAWLSHWAWRFVEYRKGSIKKFFDKPWLITHIAAVGLFVWWLPTLVRQFATAQHGFWIPPLGAYTPIDYASNGLIYLQYGAVKGWWAVLFFTAVLAAILLIRRGLPHLLKISRSATYLVVSLAVVPPVLMIMISVPPLEPSFIDRYTLYAQAFALVLIGLCFVGAYVSSSTKRKSTIMAGLVIVAALVAGTNNVYMLGNYNKNSSTSIRVREVVQQINDISTDTQPIIATSPWIYYEAVFYESSQNPVYFLESTTNNYYFGSLKMLEDNDHGKIIDLDEFTDSERYVWYLGNRADGDVIPPDDSWQQIRTVEAYDSINDNVRYRASLFDTRPSEQ